MLEVWEVFGSCSAQQRRLRQLVARLTSAGLPAWGPLQTASASLWGQPALTPRSPLPVLVAEETQSCPTTNVPCQWRCWLQWVGAVGEESAAPPSLRGLKPHLTANQTFSSPQFGVSLSPWLCTGRALHPGIFSPT